MDIFGSKYAALEEKHQAAQRQCEEAKSRLLSQSQQLDRQKNENAELTKRLKRSEAENVQLAIRCENLRKELATLRALVPPLSEGESVFLPFGDEMIRFDKIEKFRVNEEGLVVEMPPAKVSFGYGEKACRIHRSVLEALITGRYRGPSNPQEK